MTPARHLWTLFEPLHAVTYFTAEAGAAFESTDYRGFWRGYFAGRSAPLGLAWATGLGLASVPSPPPVSRSARAPPPTTATTKTSATTRRCWFVMAAW